MVIEIKNAKQFVCLEYYLLLNKCQLKFGE